MGAVHIIDCIKMLYFTILCVLVLTHWAHHAAAAAGHDAVPAQADLAYSVTPQAGRPLDLSVELKRLPGLKPIPTAKFQVAHDQLLHVVGMGEDLDTFFHWHPSDKTLSAFSIKNTVFPKAGTYLIGVDGQLADGPVASSTKAKITGSPRMGAARGADAGNPASVTVRGIPLMPHQPAVSLRSLTVNPAATRSTSDSSNTAGRAGVYTVTLSGPQGAACKPGTAATYVWTLTRNVGSSNDRQPVNDLRLYYGAPMHLAVVKSDLSSIQHVHGDIVPDSRAGSTSTSTGSSSSNTGAMPDNAGAMSHNAGSHAGHGRKTLQASHGNMPQMGQPSSSSAGGHGQHSGGEGSKLPAKFGPALKTEVVFPAAGRYLLVGQVSRGNELILLPVFVSCTG